MLSAIWSRSSVYEDGRGDCCCVTCIHCCCMTCIHLGVYCEEVTVPSRMLSSLLSEMVLICGCSAECLCPVLPACAGCCNILCVYVCAYCGVAYSPLYPALSKEKLDPPPSPPLSLPLAYLSISHYPSPLSFVLPLIPSLSSCSLVLNQISWLSLVLPLILPPPPPCLSPFSHLSHGTTATGTKNVQSVIARASKHL